MDKDLPADSAPQSSSTSEAIIATQSFALKQRTETHIVDLSQSSNANKQTVGIHCLESIAYLKKRKAAQLLAIELERLRVINGRMCRVIDCFLAQSAEELGAKATAIRNAFIEELCMHGKESNGEFLKISHKENVEGSLYINFGCEIIRYRWDGTEGDQHIYLNGERNFFRARSNSYATIERFSGKPMHFVFNECPESKPLSKRISGSFFDIEHHRYELELKRYNTLRNRLCALFGRGFKKPLQPEPADIQVKLSPLDLGLTFTEHDTLIRSLGIIATGLERAVETFQAVWATALTAEDSAED